MKPVYCPACTDSYYRTPRWGGYLTASKPLTYEQMVKIHNASPRPEPKRHKMTRIGREWFCHHCGTSVQIRCSSLPTEAQDGKG